MKKILSTTLAMLLFISSLTCMTVGSASAQEIGLSADYSISVGAYGNCDASASEETVSEGESVTLTATVYGDDEFYGWIDADTFDIISEQATYTVESVSGDMNLIAFASGTRIDLWPSLGIWNDTDPNYCRNELSANEYPEGAVGPGYKAKNLSANSLSALVSLYPNTEYCFSIWVKGDAQISNVSSEMWVVDARAEFPTASGDRYRHWSGAYNPVDLDYSANLVTRTTIDEGGSDWRQVKFYFTTDGAEEYIIAFKFVNGTSDSYQYYTDAKIEAVEPGDAPANEELLGHTGVSLRKESESANGQALRFKFTIAKSELGIYYEDTSTLMEYGAIVATYDSIIEYGTLEPSMVRNEANKYNVIQGIAYERDSYNTQDELTNIVFGENDDEVTYTIALYNIAHDDYDKIYAVRPYACFVDEEGNAYYRYGDTQYASVYDVAWEILNSDPAVEEDVEYVNTVLLPEGSEQRAGYEAWVEELDQIIEDMFGDLFGDLFDDLFGDLGDLFGQSV